MSITDNPNIQRAMSLISSWPEWQKTYQITKYDSQLGANETKGNAKYNWMKPSTEHSGVRVAGSHL